MREWRTLAATLQDCRDGKYTHLSEPERDLIADRMSSRIEEITAEIGKFGSSKSQAS